MGVGWVLVLKFGWKKSYFHVTVLNLWIHEKIFVFCSWSYGVSRFAFVCCHLSLNTYHRCLWWSFSVFLFFQSVEISKLELVELLGSATAKFLNRNRGLRFRIPFPISEEIHFSPTSRTYSSTVPQFLTNRLHVKIK